MPIIALQHTTDHPWHEQVNAVPLAIVYKHSPTCELSAQAMEEVKVLSRERDDVPIFLVDVLLQRSLSNEIEARLHIRHESPQAIIMKGGQPVWNGSHRQVNLKRLSDALPNAATLNASES